MKIQFFGEKNDRTRIRDAFQKLVDRSRLGNITLVPSMLSLRDEAVLQIEVGHEIRAIGNSHIIPK